MNGYDLITLQLDGRELLFKNAIFFHWVLGFNYWFAYVEKSH
jgi:hypothetical protein